VNIRRFITAFREAMAKSNPVPAEETPPPALAHFQKNESNPEASAPAAQEKPDRPLADMIEEAMLQHATLERLRRMVAEEVDGTVTVFIIPQAARC
jgi:hypothetical protein